MIRIKRKKPVGRPKVDGLMRRKQYTIRLPQWLINWLKSQDFNQSRYIERLICEDQCEDKIDIKLFK